MPNNRRLLGLTGADGQVLTARPGHDLLGEWGPGGGGGGGAPIPATDFNACVTTGVYSISSGAANGLGGNSPGALTVTTLAPVTTPLAFSHADAAAVQATTAVTSTSVNLTNPVNQNDLLVAIVGSPDTPTVHDSNYNQWTVANFVNYTALAYCLSASPSPSLTVTASNSTAPGTMALAVDRFSIAGGGVASFITSGNNFVSGASGDAGLVGDPTGGNFLYAGLHTDNPGITFTPGASNGLPLTTGIQVTNGSGSVFTEYLGSTAAGNQSASWVASAPINGNRCFQAIFVGGVGTVVQSYQMAYNPAYVFARSYINGWTPWVQVTNN